MTKKQKIIKKCPVCNLQFLARKEKQKTCSFACKVEKKRLENKNIALSKVKICSICNSSFKPNNKNQITCSKKCMGISFRKPDFLCENCGSSFRKEGVTKAKFCSKSCYFSHCDKRIKILKSDEENPYRILKNCENCKKEVYLWRYEIKEKNYCSKECYYEIRRVSRICKACKKKYTRAFHRSKERGYCSQECAKTNIQSISKNEIELRNRLKEVYNIKNNKSIKIKNAIFNVDILLGNKIIEYYGDYYHCNPEVYSEEYFNKKLKMSAKEKWEKDMAKQIFLKENGYEVLVVWEKDFNKNKKECFEKCLNFLKQK